MIRPEDMYAVIDGGGSEDRWFHRFAAEHDRLAKVIRAHFPDEPRCGKPTEVETAFDVAVRLLNAVREKP